jgi:hypothetical protein
MHKSETISWAASAPGTPQVIYYKQFAVPYSCASCSGPDKASRCRASCSGRTLRRWPGEPTAVTVVRRPGPNGPTTCTVAAGRNKRDYATSACNSVTRLRLPSPMRSRCSDSLRPPGSSPAEAPNHLAAGWRQGFHLAGSSARLVLADREHRIARSTLFGWQSAEPPV